MIAYIWVTVILFLLSTLVSMTSFTATFMDDEREGSVLFGTMFSFIVSFTMFILGIVVLVTS